MSVIRAWRVTGSALWVGAVVGASALAYALAAWLGVWGFIFWFRVLFGPGEWFANIWAGIGAFLLAAIIGMTFVLVDLLTYFRRRIAQLAQAQLDQRVRIIVVGGPPTP
jgi:hypothetical protein